ncbi:MAG: hypothetical protein ABF334_03985, partial [Akkermansiaceae bacterium]
DIGGSASDNAALDFLGSGVLILEDEVNSPHGAQLVSVCAGRERSEQDAHLREKETIKKVLQRMNKVLE